MKLVKFIKNIILILNILIFIKNKTTELQFNYSFRQKTSFTLNLQYNFLGNTAIKIYTSMLLLGIFCLIYKNYPTNKKNNLKNSEIIFNKNADQNPEKDYEKILSQEEKQNFDKIVAQNNKNFFDKYIIEIQKKSANKKNNKDYLLLLILFKLTKEIGDKNHTINEKKQNKFIDEALIKKYFDNFNQNKIKISQEKKQNNLEINELLFSFKTNIQSILLSNEDNANQINSLKNNLNILNGNINNLKTQKLLLNFPDLTFETNREILTDKNLLADFLKENAIKINNSEIKEEQPMTLTGENINYENEINN